MNSLLVKICCITSVEEATLALRFGANALGLVSSMPSGPGVIDEAEIRKIVTHIPGGTDTFLLTSRTDLDEITRQFAYCATTTIQLCDRLSREQLHDLRERIPTARLVQVIHVEGERSVNEAVLAADGADALLLDSGRPRAAVKELGGTGRVHDWSVSCEIVESVPVPVYLAGGLNAENVAEAVDAVQPAGVDVCSGVRTDGALDPRKLHAFFEAVARFRTGIWPVSASG